MTLNEIITNAITLNNAEKHTLRTILQNILNCELCSKIYRIIADTLYHAHNIAYTLYERFTDILYINILKKGTSA